MADSAGWSGLRQAHAVLRSHMCRRHAWDSLWFVTPVHLPMASGSPAAWLHPLTWQSQGSKCGNKGQIPMFKGGSSVFSWFTFSRALFGPNEVMWPTWIQGEGKQISHIDDRMQYHIERVKMQGEKKYIPFLQATTVCI